MKMYGASADDAAMLVKSKLYSSSQWLNREKYLRQT